MKFTHRSAGPRKGNGASPVTKVKVKADSIICRKCGEHTLKCACDYTARRPLATLSDTELAKAARKRYEVGQCIEIRMVGSLMTAYSATVTEVNEDRWPIRIVLDSGWVLKHGDFVILNSTWLPASRM